MITISVFLKNNASKPPFIESQCKKINSLFQKDAFKVISILDVPSIIKIFNSCFVNEIKNKKIAMTFEKSKHIVQAYNNYDKEEILTQSLVI